MKTEDFYYDLPERLIAQYPLEDRQGSRLLLLNKDDGSIIDGTFKNIKDYLKPGDCLVLNDTRVIPARLFGNRRGKNEKIEFLLLRRIDKDVWETLVKPGKKVRPPDTIIFGNGILNADVRSIGQDGTRRVKFNYNGIFEEILDELGEMPLPPYIKASLKEKERYQTVYSKHKGSVAAPTAGLHFTKESLKQIEEKGINIVYLTLHVGLGTFRPVKAEDVEDHCMHTEYYELPMETARAINETRNNGGKIIAVGTTTTRVLETSSSQEGIVLPQHGWTDIFIYPGYRFKVVDQLITNFHLPESTLIMLVSALAGKENILKAYRHAIENEYRFFSFGDAMFIR